MSAHLVAAALGAAQLCCEHEHTHGGVPAPDCPMHHGTNGDGQPGHHSHHGDAVRTEGEGSATPRLSCHCPGDLLMLLISEVGVLRRPVSHAPFIQAVSLGPLNPLIALDHSFSPPSPPPR